VTKTPARGAASDGRTPGGSTTTRSSGAPPTSGRVDDGFKERTDEPDEKFIAISVVATPFDESARDRAGCLMGRSSTATAQSPANPSSP
jgi:hypothetical protein